MAAAPTARSLSGTLTKQGHIFRTWKERWFVLEGHLLKYYKAEGADQASGNLGELKGVVNLQNCSVDVADASSADGKLFCFKITPMSNKIFLIKASDPTTRDKWIAAIRVNAQLGGTGGGDAGSSEGLEEPEGSSVKNVVGDDSSVTLGDFELLKVIGRGTYGKVMQVRRRDTNEVYAMKVLKKENIFARNDPKDLQHTIAERNVLALVNTSEHPFILGLKFAFHTPAKLYYVLNFCNGGDLYYLLSRCKKFKESQARFYASEVFCALQHLHLLGVIYRDLKPENVLLDGDGHVKLTDFGLSKESPTADTFCGTPVYLAPEIWLRRTYGFEVDWWSLGCVLFEMVTGLPPFWGDTIKDVYKKVINTQPKFPPMTAECQSCIERLLNREPKQRLGSVDNGADIRSHPYFASVAWEELLKKEVRPPFKSKSSSTTDAQNFHKAFTTQAPIDSLTNPDALLTQEQEAHFDGFTYVPKAPTDTPRGNGEVAQVEPAAAALRID
mmetsp:Transcript_17668/g.35587  ORF Transcript_17668/g.35587 Transcript_17668/m.35587 type:complete len:499 (-) Transcript_17668:473-1969(-)